MDFWEAFVFMDSNTASLSLEDGGSSSETTILYVLAASLFLDWITEASTSGLWAANAPPPDEVIFGSRRPGKGPWQLSQGLEILRRPNASSAWCHGFLGLWPILIFGYAVSSEGEMMLLRNLLRDILQRLTYGEVQRTLDELEAVWSVRKAQVEEWGERGDVDIQELFSSRMSVQEMCLSVP